MAGGAAGFEFVGEGSQGLVIRRVVIELEQVGALTVHALVPVGFHDHPLLPGRRVATPTRCVHRPTLGIVDQETNERPVELAENGMVGGRGAVVERGTLAAHVDNDFGCQDDR